MGKLYVIVPKSMPIVHKAIQAGHAIVDFMRSHPDSKWNGGSLVYLTVDTDDGLSKLLEEVQGWGRTELGWFHEPYWGNRLTAIAIHGDETDNGRLKHLPLMKG